jgi:hypothetical protein
MGIATLLSADEAKRIEQAWPRYAELLMRDATDAKGVAEIKSVMSTLGKSPAEADADQQLLFRARDLVRTIRDGCNLSEPSEKAAKAVAEHNAETLRIREQRAAQLRQLLAVESEINSRYLVAQTAGHTLRTLKENHKQLLAIIEVPELT